MYIRLIFLRHSQPKFKPWRLRSKQHPFPELQAKAWNVLGHALIWGAGCGMDFFFYGGGGVWACVGVDWLGFFPLEARCVIAWLSAETISWAKAFADDQWLSVAASCLWLGLMSKYLSIICLIYWPTSKMFEIFLFEIPCLGGILQNGTGMLNDLRTILQLIKPIISKTCVTSA